MECFPEVINCKECGKEFEPFGKQKYCSIKCRNSYRTKYSNQRNKALKRHIDSHNASFEEKINYYFNRCKKNADKRNLSFELTKEEFSLFLGKSCIYCHKIIKGISIDRWENSIGYTSENSVPCCPTCNYMKWTLSGDEFIRLCKAIAKIHSI